MKKIIFSMLMALVSVMAFAQTADFNKAVAKYKSVSSLTANVVKTTHKAAVAKDVVEKGAYYVKKPNKVLISCNGGKDALLMNGTAFTMTIKGRKAKTDSQKNPQFKTFHDVLESVYSGGAVDLSKNNDVKITKSGSKIVLTITPASDPKKHQMFTSFVVTIDSKTSELSSLRMNQKGGSYTEYTFSGYNFGANVSDSVFK